MKKQKRVTLNMLQAYDKKHGESIVRLLEMSVESLLMQQAYSLQFWRDVSIYGLSEAYLLLHNQPLGIWFDLAAIRKLEKLVNEVNENVLADKPMHCIECGKRLSHGELMYCKECGEEEK